jgi:hypothetical protein
LASSLIDSSVRSERTVPELLVRCTLLACAIGCIGTIFPAGQTWCFLRAGCASSCTAAFGIAAHAAGMASPLIDHINDRNRRCGPGFGLFPPDVQAFKGHAAFHRVPERWEF